MILVCAASGRIGSRILNKLCETVAPENIVAGVRNLDNTGDLPDRGISARVVDYDNLEGLNNAFEGIERIVFIPSYADTQQRAQQGLNLIEAAEKQGVKQVVFIGFADAREESPLPFAKAYATIEKAFEESSLDWTILRTAMYTGNLEEQIPVWLKTGNLMTCAGDGKISYVSRRDITNSVVGVLASPVETHARKRYKLTGPEALSYEEVCSVVNVHFNARVEVEHLPVDEFAEKLLKIWGVAYPGHEHVARVTPLFQVIFKQGMLAEVTDHVELLSGSAPETVLNWFERNLDPGQFSQD